MVVTPALMDLFIFSDASTWSQIALPPLRNSHHLLSQFSLAFHEAQKRKLFIIAQLMNILELIGTVSMTIWEMFCRRISLWKILVINDYILHCKHQVKAHPSPSFSADGTAAIARRNHFFRMFQQNKSSASKLKFKQASNRFKRLLETAKYASVNETKESSTS